MHHNNIKSTPKMTKMPKKHWFYISTMIYISSHNEFGPIVIYTISDI